MNQRLITPLLLAMLPMGLALSSNSTSDGSCSAADPGSCVGGISLLQHRGALQKVEAHHLKVKSTKDVTPLGATSGTGHDPSKCGEYKQQRLKYPANCIASQSNGAGACAPGFQLKWTGVFYYGSSEYFECLPEEKGKKPEPGSPMLAGKSCSKGAQIRSAKENRVKIWNGEWSFRQRMDGALLAKENRASERSGPSPVTDWDFEPKFVGKFSRDVSGDKKCVKKSISEMKKLGFQGTPGCCRLDRGHGNSVDEFRCHVFAGGYAFNYAPHHRQESRAVNFNDDEAIIDADGDEEDPPEAEEIIDADGDEADHDVNDEEAPQKAKEPEKEGGKAEEEENGGESENLSRAQCYGDSSAKIATIQSVNTLQDCEQQCSRANKQQNAVECKFYSYQPSKNRCRTFSSCGAVRKNADWASYKMQ